MKDEISEILKSEDLKDISIDIVEAVLDAQITDEILKEIPIVKSLIAAKNIYSSISDRIFIKKTMSVLLELCEVDLKQRESLTNDLDDEHDSGTEKILMAIDKLETIRKCKVFGRLCKLRALDKIDKHDFLRLTKLLQDSYLDDLILVIDFQDKERKQIHEGDYYPIISLGLLMQEPSEQKRIEINHRRSDEDEPEIIGGEIEFNYFLTDLGMTLRKYYYDLFPEDTK